MVDARELRADEQSRAVGTGSGTARQRAPARSGHSRRRPSGAGRRIHPASGRSPANPPRPTSGPTTGTAARRHPGADGRSCRTAPTRAGTATTGADRGRADTQRARCGSQPRGTEAGWQPRRSGPTPADAGRATRASTPARPAPDSRSATTRQRRSATGQSVPRRITSAVCRHPSRCCARRAPRLPRPGCLPGQPHHAGGGSRWRIRRSVRGSGVGHPRRRQSRRGEHASGRRPPGNPGLFSSSTPHQ